MKEIPLKPLAHHCFELAYIFFELRHRYRHPILHHQTSEWLNVAAGLEDISFDSRRLYALTSGGNIDIDHRLYENARQKNKDLVFALIRFEMIWSGLRCIDNALKKGVTSDLSELIVYMSKNYSGIKNLDGYNCTLRKLRRLSRIHGIRIRHNLMNFPSSMRGVELVAELRSLFVKCAYAFPFSHQVQLDEGTDPELVHMSSRIVLMTMQMLLLTMFAGRDDRIDSWWHINKKGRLLTTHAMLRTVHLQGGAE